MTDVELREVETQELIAVSNQHSPSLHRRSPQEDKPSVWTEGCMALPHALRAQSLGAGLFALLVVGPAAATNFTLHHLLPPQVSL